MFQKAPVYGSCRLKHPFAFYFIGSEAMIRLTVPG